MSACALFSASGYVQEALLTDYVRDGDERDVREQSNERQRLSHASGTGNRDPRASVQGGRRGEAAQSRRQIGDSCHGRRSRRQRPPWRGIRRFAGSARSRPSGARKDDIAGLAVASDERIEACLLYVRGGEIVALRSFVEDDGARLRQLLARLGAGTFRFPRVNPAEISTELLETSGFRPAGRHVLYAATARSA